MGIINDLKKLFFGASSVAKHSSEKAGNFIKEEGEEMIDKTKLRAREISEDVSEKTSALRESIRENSEELLEKAKNKIDELGDKPIFKKAADTSEKVGEKIISTGEKLADKAADISEDVGARILEEGREATDKGKELSEKIGKKAFEIKDDLIDKAQDAAEKIGKKLDETMDKAEAWAEAEKKKPKKDFADDDLDASGSLLEEKDDFFSKASKYADGDYDAFSEGQIKIEHSEEQKLKDNTPATGFEDLDGDGNEIIDDAIIEEEKPEKDNPEK